MKDWRLTISPVTDRVYACKLNNDGSIYRNQKFDVTNDFIHAAVKRWNGYEETIRHGTRKFKIRVEEVE